jgi:hypothetical protein
VWKERVARARVNAPMPATHKNLPHAASQPGLLPLSGIFTGLYAVGTGGGKVFREVSISSRSLLSCLCASVLFVSRASPSSPSASRGRDSRSLHVRRRLLVGRTVLCRGVNGRSSLFSSAGWHRFRVLQTE